MKIIWQVIYKKLTNFKVGFIVSGPQVGNSPDLADATGDVVCFFI